MQPRTERSVKVTYKIDPNRPHVIEAIRRSKFKFPGRQKIIESAKWGFTKFSFKNHYNVAADKLTSLLSGTWRWPGLGFIKDGNCRRCIASQTSLF